MEKLEPTMIVLEIQGQEGLAEAQAGNHVSDMSRNYCPAGNVTGCSAIAEPTTQRTNVGRTKPMEQCTHGRSVLNAQGQAGL